MRSPQESSSFASSCFGWDSALRSALPMGVSSYCRDDGAAVTLARSAAASERLSDPALGAVATAASAARDSDRTTGTGENAPQNQPARTPTPTPVARALLRVTRRLRTGRLDGTQDPATLDVGCLNSAMSRPNANPITDWFGRTLQCDVSASRLGDHSVVKMPS